MTRPLCFVTVLAAAIPLVPRAPACAVAPPRDGQVEVASETALIVWDAATKTEHFVRAASFTANSADFGFLVPTPSKPDVAAADDAGFHALLAATAPKTQVTTKEVLPELDFGCDQRLTMLMGGGGAASAPAAGRVTVVEQKQVGEYDVAVLQADDATALKKWLEEHGYDARPALTEWLETYVNNKWFVTAFKITSDAPTRSSSAPPPSGKAAPAPKPATRTASASAIRMSFATERPFYPYREPLDQRNVPAGGSPTNRLLRVFVLNSGKMAGTLGEKGEWPGKAVWANAVETPVIEKLIAADKLPATIAGQKWYLTEFEDASSPRPGTDEIYFAPAADQTAIERPPVIVTHYREWPPRDAVAAVVFGGPVLIAVALLIRRTRRRGSVAPA